MQSQGYLKSTTMIYIQINGIITELETVMDINIRIIKQNQPSMEEFEESLIKEQKKLKRNRM